LEGVSHGLFEGTTPEFTYTAGRIIINTVRIVDNMAWDSKYD